MLQEIISSTCSLLGLVPQFGSFYVRRLFEPHVSSHCLVIIMCLHQVTRSLFHKLSSYTVFIPFGISGVEFSTRPSQQQPRFGLPKGGRCAPGQTPSKDAWRSGCTWSVQKRLKTIHQANSGMLDTCSNF